MKKLLAPAIAAAVVAVALSAATASAQSGGGCQLQGSANFNPGLSTTAQNFSYNFTGSLSNCQSTSGGPTSGTVFSGTNGLPSPTGSGSCVSSSTSGIAVVQWSDSTTTVIQYSTSGAAAAVALQGTVIPSVTSSTGTTYTTTRYAAGDSAEGQFAFQPPSPTSCQTGATTATISGATELGGA